MSTGNPELEALAALVRQRNEVEAAIAARIGRPGHPGHVGEYIASRIFDIALEGSATAPGIDGRFRGGPLTGRTVDVKFYPRNNGILDINPKAVPDFYLVLTGPWTPAASSRKTSAPWVITHVYLFDAEELLDALRQRGVKIGVATSIIRALWEAAEVYPAGRSPHLRCSPQQAQLLRLFAPA